MATTNTSAELYSKALTLRLVANGFAPEWKLLGDASAEDISAIMKDYIKLRLEKGISDELAE